MDEGLNSQFDGAVPSNTLPYRRGFAVHLSPPAARGCWVDIVELPGGRTGVALGACTDPSAVGPLRSDLREALYRNADPVPSLVNLNGVPASALCAVIDETTLVYTTHGATATAVISPGDRSTTAEAGRPVVADLAPGATVLFSTTPIPGAAALLADGAALHPDHLADRAFTGGPVGSPGIAAVLYRHPPGPMTITLAASPANLAVSRARLRDWLSEAGVDPDTCADVLLAVGEATANAAEHSVVGADHEVRLTVNAALSGKLLALTVSDDGRWKPAAGEQGHRGHGMHLINALVDSVELTTTPGGTTVTMLKELP